MISNLDMYVCLRVCCMTVSFKQTTVSLTMCLTLCERFSSGLVQER